MRSIILALLYLSLLSNGTAFAEAKRSEFKAIKSKKCVFPKSRKRAPSWVCGEQDENIETSSVGSFAKSKGNLAFREQMAAANAREKLAGKMNSEILEGAEVLKSTIAPNGTLYVLIGIKKKSTP
jgi:hypothetical protein